MKKDSITSTGLGKLKSYSNRERLMFNWFGLKDDVLDCIEPQDAIRTAAYNAVADNGKYELSPQLKALSRCLKAFRDCTVYRNTKEWEDLIGDCFDA